MPTELLETCRGFK